jgi:hypothetical protein
VLRSAVPCERCLISMNPRPGFIAGFVLGLLGTCVSAQLDAGNISVFNVQSPNLSPFALQELRRVPDDCPPWYALAASLPFGG